jgi:starch synthase
MSLKTIQSYFSPASYDKFKAIDIAYLKECAKHSKVGATGIIVDPNYRFDHLDNETLIELYSSLSELSTQAQFADVMSYHLFDIEDHILRLVSDDVTLGPVYQDLLQKKTSAHPQCALNNKIQNILSQSSRIFSLESTTTNKTKTILDYRIKSDQLKPLNNKRPNKVLKICLENKTNPIGGISSVLLGLRSAHSNSSLDKVYSLHPLYEKDKVAARDYVFQGVVTHQFEGKLVTSSIYKNKNDHEYLVQPDPAFRHIFNISHPAKVYDNNQDTTLADRLLYIGSAATAFAALYRGKSGDKQIDVIQSEHGVTGACASLLLKDVFNTIRTSAGLPKIHTIQVFHNGNLGDKCSCPINRLASLGLHTLPSSLITPWIPCLDESAKHSDRSVFVSSDLASRAITPDPYISQGFHKLLTPTQVVSIRNGIDSSHFDPVQFKDLALTRTFDANGIETTDYMAYRKDIKQKLFNAGLISHPDLPLVVYVGRYSPEKGLDILSSTIKNIDPKTTQFVTMGDISGTNIHLSQLQDLEKKSHKDALRVYTKREDQKKLFSDGTKTYDVSVGQLIRAAADAFIVPSHVEACGIVPMEGVCGGSVVIAPYHQGLKDICQPVSKTNTWQQTANAVCYTDHTNSSQATAALAQALQDLSKMTLNERNILARRLRNYAVENYSWYHKDGITKTGVVVAYHKLYNSLCNRAEDLSNGILKAPEQSPIKAYPINQHLLQRIKHHAIQLFTFLFSLFSSPIIYIYHLTKTLLIKPIKIIQGSCFLNVKNNK